MDRVTWSWSDSCLRGYGQESGPFSPEDKPRGRHQHSQQRLLPGKKSAGCPRQAYTVRETMWPAGWLWATTWHPCVGRLHLWRESNSESEPNQWGLGISAGAGHRTNTQWEPITVTVEVAVSQLCSGLSEGGQHNLEPWGGAPPESTGAASPLTGQEPQNMSVWQPVILSHEYPSEITNFQTKTSSLL